MRKVGIGVLILVGMLALIWVVRGNDFFLYRTFAPKYEQVRRDTFEQSKAYRQGMVQELQNMQFEYAKAAPAQRDALASVILHRAADVDEGVMPADLRSFVAQLRRDRAAAR